MACEEIRPGKTCVLEPKCVKKTRSGKCEFLGHYENLEVKLNDPPLVRQIKERMRLPFMESWTSFVKDPQPGKKRMTGGAFEKAIREIFREKLAPFEVEVSPTGKKFKFGKAGPSIIADCVIEKEKHPTSIISAKTWLGPEQVRETFASAYFAKRHYGLEGIRVFMAIFQPFKENAELEEACKPYIDGTYSLGEPRYIDKLLEELQRIYAS